jgi:hypothetical protein
MQAFQAATTKMTGLSRVSTDTNPLLSDVHTFTLQIAAPKLLSDHGARIGAKVPWTAIRSIHLHMEMPCDPKN